MDGFMQSSDPVREDSVSKTDPHDTSRKPIRKVSYAVSCSSAFRDAVLALAEERYAADYGGLRDVIDFLLADCCQGDQRLCGP